MALSLEQKGCERELLVKHTPFVNRMRHTPKMDDVTMNLGPQGALVTLNLGPSFLRQYREMRPVTMNRGPCYAELGPPLR